MNFRFDVSKIRRNFIICILMCTLLVLLSSCCLGSGGSMVSAYSLRSSCADGISAEAEQRIVDRLHHELAYDLPPQ